MGAFYICPETLQPDPEVLSLFDKKGFAEPLRLSCQGVNALFYPKQSINSLNKIESSASTLYISGTCFYKGKNYKTGLQKILSDFNDNEFNPGELSGNYFLLFRKENKLTFFSDPAAVQNIFFHPTSGVISSSFLACIMGAARAKGTLKLNKDALIEIMITGNLIGPDTLIDGIERYEPGIHKNLPGIDRIPASEVKHSKSRTGKFDTEVDRQLKALNDYFADLSPVMDELGVSSGLTGGFDSRLIFLAMKKHTSNFQLYSTSRSKPTKEFLCAESLAGFFNQKIKSPKHRTYSQMSSYEFLQLLEENFYFNDAIIRTNQLWTEEIKSKSYLQSLYGDQLLGLSGVGGEQYRNGEYLIKNRYSFREWYFYEMVFRNCRNPFKSSIEKKRWLEIIKKKIFALLGADADESHISRFDIKRYYNEIYNPANRVLRNNIENQLHFFLSPFTEYTVSQKAYDAFPFLGSHHRFQKEMITRLAPEARHIEMDYGYKAGEKVPLRFRLVPWLKAFLGQIAFFKVYLLPKKKGKLLEKMIKAHPELKDYLSLVETLKLPLNIEQIKTSDHLSPLLIEAGLFLHKMKKHIQYD